MKAAVLRTFGVPQFDDFADPQPRVGMHVVSVHAATVNAVDIAIASGRHFVRPEAFPVVTGVEGVGELGDGRRVYFNSPTPPYGSMAERTLVAESSMIDLPEGVDDAVAATLGNAGLAAVMPLSWRAAMRPGENVLILGATGVVGRLAVQAAKLLGAGVVVAAGRDPQALEETAADCGADATVRLDDRDTSALAAAYTSAAGGSLDVVLDYTWGRPAQAALAALAENGRLVQVGDRAGTSLTVDAQVLRRAGLAVFGFMPRHAARAAVHAAYRQAIEWAMTGRLRVDLETMPLRQVAHAWARESTTRHKLVLLP